MKIDSKVLYIEWIDRVFWANFLIKSPLNSDIVKTKASSINYVALKSRFAGPPPPYVTLWLRWALTLPLPLKLCNIFFKYYLRHQKIFLLKLIPYKKNVTYTFHLHLPPHMLRFGYTELLSLPPKIMLHSMWMMPYQLFNIQFRKARVYQLSKTWVTVKLS